MPPKSNRATVVPGRTAPAGVDGVILGCLAKNKNPHEPLARARAQAQELVIAECELKCAKRGYTLYDVGGSGGFVRTERVVKNLVSACLPGQKIAMQGYHFSVPDIDEQDPHRFYRIEDRINPTDLARGVTPYRMRNAFDSVVGQRPIVPTCCRHSLGDCPLTGQHACQVENGVRVFLLCHCFYYMSESDFQNFKPGDVVYIVIHPFVGDSGSFEGCYHWRRDACGNIHMEPDGPCGQSYHHRDVTHLLGGFYIQKRSGRTLFFVGSEMASIGADGSTRVIRMIATLDCAKQVPHIAARPVAKADAPPPTSVVASGPPPNDPARQYVVAALLGQPSLPTAEALVRITSQIVRRFDLAIPDAERLVVGALEETNETRALYSGVASRELLAARDVDEDCRSAWFYRAVYEREERMRAANGYYMTFWQKVWFYSQYAANKMLYALKWTFISLFIAVVAIFAGFLAHYKLAGDGGF